MHVALQAPAILHIAVPDLRCIMLHMLLLLMPNTSYRALRAHDASHAPAADAKHRNIDADCSQENHFTIWRCMHTAAGAGCRFHRADTLQRHQNIAHHPSCCCCQYHALLTSFCLTAALNIATGGLLAACTQQWQHTSDIAGMSIMSSNIWQHRKARDRSLLACRSPTVMEVLRNDCQYTAGECCY